MPINISNAKNRDAVIALEGVRPKRDIHYVDLDRQQVTNRRMLKTDITHELPELINQFKPEIANDTPEMVRYVMEMDAVSEALINGDPEIDVEKFGMYLTETSRIYLSEAGIVHAIEEFEVVYNADGSIRDRRPRKKEPQNINTDLPLRWSGKFIKKQDAINRFVFTGKKQLIHINGLTYDFLFDIATELDKRDALMLVRAGEKIDNPLILNRGGKAYNAFLEGRIDGESYCLILHLSNMELKKPAVPETDEKETEETA